MVDVNCAKWKIGSLSKDGGTYSGASFCGEGWPGSKASDVRGFPPHPVLWICFQFFNGRIEFKLFFENGRMIK